jgi:hypothetical protein
MKNAILFLASWLLCANISYTCWFGDSNSFHKIFDTDSISDASLLSLVGYEKGLWMGYSEKATSPKDANLEDWKNYLKADIAENDLDEVIYKTEATRLKELTSNKKVLLEAAKKNKVFELWSNNQNLCQAMGNYLIYAKKCEKEALRAVEEWSDTEIVRDAAFIRKMIDEGLKESKKQKEVFLSKRYAFQAIRMAFYLNDTDKVLSLFNEYFGKESNEDYIYFRALEVKAGALHQKGNDEAAYYFASVFLNCPDRREICVRSFSVTSESGWNRSISLCKNKEEKAVFFALRGLQKGSNLAEEIMNIAEIAPNSALLEMLTARYISTIQPSRFPMYYYEPQTFPVEAEANNAELQNFKRTVNTILSNNNVNRDFWLITSAYLDLLDRKTDEAQKTAAQVSEKSKLKTEAEIVRMAARICGLKKADPASVSALWTEIKNNSLLQSNQIISDFWDDAVSLIFLNNGEKARSFLVNNEIAALREKLDLQLIEYLEQYLRNSSSHSDYDKFLIKNQCGSVENALDMLGEMRAMYYLQRNKLDLAITELEKCSKDYLSKSEYFNSSYINKTIWSEKIDYPMFEVELSAQKIVKTYEKYSFLDKKYNLLSYIKQLRDLEQKAENEPEKAGEYYYLLGLARYNTGVWGWHRPLMYFMSSNYGYAVWWTADKEETETKVYKNYIWSAELYHDVDIAKNYLEKALKSTKDPELKAKTLYMMAKVEKIRNLKNYWEDDNYSNEYYDMFKELKSKYSKTAFYKELLRECYDFYRYVDRN